jgi:thiamine-phosphate pyrophosphorylase
VKSLYVTDRQAAGDVRLVRLLESLRGATNLSVQLRERQSTDRETLTWAGLAREALGPGVRLFVNRRFDIALAARADGVHLPADGLPVPRVRANTPRGFRIGVSTHSAREAADALQDGADLVVLGPIFATPGKEGLGAPLGPQALADLPASREQAGDVFAIGGITEENIDELMPWRDRISGIAGIRIFQEAADAAALAARITAW